MAPSPSPGAGEAGCFRRAVEIAAAVREATELAKQAKSAAELLGHLGPVEQRIDQVLQEARTDDFDDVAHDLAALKELVAAMRRKLQGP